MNNGRTSMGFFTGSACHSLEKYRSSRSILVNPIRSSESNPSSSSTEIMRVAAPGRVVVISKLLKNPGLLVFSLRLSFLSLISFPPS
jgi:hypothetical protein